MNLFDLAGRVAIVTGSSRGMERAIAERLAEHGARVVMSSRNPEACAAAAVFFASRAGSFVTGQAIIADGGATITWG
jgi:NAD(P)-dependent dehydrogenase (short-subunit alcohol dehydrogenase family)